MPYKDQEAQRKAQREWAAKRRSEGRMHVQRMRQFVAELKESAPCTDCGNRYPYYVMDYDHLGDDDKVDRVSMLCYRSKEVILQEIAKCELVCANCHRIRTWNRSQLTPS